MEAGRADPTRNKRPTEASEEVWINLLVLNQRVSKPLTGPIKNNPNRLNSTERHLDTDDHSCFVLKVSK